MTDNNPDEQKNALPWWAANTKKTVLANKNIRKYDAGAVLVSITVVLILFGVLAWTTIGVNPITSRNSSYESVEHPSSVDAVIAQCGNIFTFTPDQKYYGIFNEADITPAENGKIVIPRQPMIVPVYGYMSENPLDPTIKSYELAAPPNYEQMIRSLYDGVTIVWYDASVPKGTQQQIKDYVSTQDKMISAVWRDERNLPLKRHVAFSSWAISMSCANWDTKVADEFFTFVDKNPEYAPKQGSIPPQAKIIEDGQLAAIRPKPDPNN